MKVAFRQIRYQYYLWVSCFSAFLLPDVISRHADTAAVLVPVLSMPLCALFALALHRAISRYGSLRRFVRTAFGARGQRAFEVLLMLRLWMICSFYLCAFYERLSATAFSFLPRALCLAALSVCAALFCTQAGQTVAKSAQIVCIIMLLCFAVLMIFSAKGVSVKAILPVKYNGFPSFLRALLYPAGLAGLLFILLYFYEAQVRTAGAILRGFAAGNAILFGMIFFIQTVFGTAFARKLAYPFFSLIKSTDSFINAEHFESLLSGVWIIISLTALIALTKLLCAASASVFALEKRKDGALLSLLPVAAVLAAALCVPDDRQISKQVLGTLMPAGNLLSAGILSAAIAIKSRFFAGQNAKIVKPE